MSVVVLTRTLALNAAFLREIKEDDRTLKQLWELSAEHAVFPLPAGDAPFLARLLGRLCDQLETHFSLEEGYGYFENAIDAAPHVSEEAARLLAQHEVMSRQAAELAASARELAAAAPYRSSARNSATQSDTARSVADDFKRLQQQFLAHEDEENDLLTQAFGEDIGVGD